MTRWCETRKKKHVRASVVRKVAACPVCAAPSKRHSVCTRTLLDVGQRVIILRYSKHKCEVCRRHFSLQAHLLAPASGKYTYGMRFLAVNILKAGKTLEQASMALRVPPTTIYDWMDWYASIA